MLKNLNEPKFSYVSIKTQLGAKAGGTCLVLNEFTILMRHEKRDVKNGTSPKTLVN